MGGGQLAAGGPRVGNRLASGKQLAGSGLGVGRRRPGWAVAMWRLTVGWRHGVGGSLYRLSFLPSLEEANGRRFTYAATLNMPPLVDAPPAGSVLLAVGIQPDGTGLGSADSIWGTPGDELVRTSPETVDKAKQIIDLSAPPAPRTYSSGALALATACSGCPSCSQ